MPKYLKEKPFDQNEKPFDQNEKPFDQNEKLKYLKENGFSTLEKAYSLVFDPTVFADLGLEIKFLRIVFVIAYINMVQTL